MKFLSNSLALLLTLVMITLAPISAAATAFASSAPQSTALERGYRTGYSDGYNAGYKDVTDGASRDFESKVEYQQANRSYNQVWGPVEDYRDGYRQGFETGYADGFDRRAFNSNIPTGLSRRDSDDTANANPPAAPAPTSTDTGAATPNVSVNGPLAIRQGTILTIELLSSLSTDVSQRGDRFQARVVQPGEYAGAIVDGRVTEVKRPGKVKGTAELQLSFEQIRLPDNRSASFRAEVIEVVQMSSSDGVGSVDPEGGVKGRDSTKDDVTKVGAATGIGAIIGAIAGGGRGAAIGAAIGGAVGTGGVLSQRGKDIRLSRGQQLRIRSSTDTQVQ